MALGGKREGAGRPKGSANKSTAEFREWAKQYTKKAFIELVRISTNSDSDSARTAAIGMILDRAYGKAAQPHDGDGDGGPIHAKVTVEYVTVVKKDENSK